MRGLLPAPDAVRLMPAALARQPSVTVPASRAGDVWLLGPHRLLCANILKLGAIEQLMDGRKADMLHTDPPYGVDHRAGFGRRGPSSKKDWRTIAGDLPDTDFLARAMGAARDATKTSAPWYVWHAGIRSAATQLAIEAAGRRVSAQIVWAKEKIGGGFGHYRYDHETCFYCSGGPSAWYGGRNQKTVWPAQRERQVAHPMQKPVALVSRAILNSTAAGELVLDPFAGSGSTLIACEMRGRRAYVAEIDPEYCDAIVFRWQDLTGQLAAHEATGWLWEEVALRRRAGSLA
jgi:DNA modification methylase